MNNIQLGQSDLHVKPICLGTMSLLPKKFTFIPALLLVSVISYAQTGSGGKDGEIEKCPSELGTLAVSEPQSQMLAELTRYKLGSPSTMLRMIAQESGCFAVVERGVAMQNIQQERALASGGMLQQDSNMGGGQLQAADFVLTSTVQFSGDTGGMGGAVGSFLGRFGGVGALLGGIAGGVNFKEAETTILVADVRSGIQVASAEGKASKMNFSLGGWGWGGMGWASAGGYSKTPEGKLIAASLLDNFNRIVQQIKSKPSLIRSTVQSSSKNAANSIQATNIAPTAAPITLPAQTIGGLPAGLIGNFSGSFAGMDQGSFNVVVGSNGMVNGIVFSKVANQTFPVAGMVTASGSMSLAGSGQAGSASYNGMIDQSTGKVQGSWMFSGKPAGTFAGQKQ